MTPFPFTTPRNSPPRRRGAAIVILLAVFAVTMLLAGVWTRRIIAEHRGQRLSLQRLQATWLAEAGVRRAAAQLVRDPDYHGEPWDLAAEELNLAAPASVRISVEPGEAPREFRLTARARYPADDHRVQITKTVTFTLPNEE